MHCFTIATAVVALFAGAVVADPPTPGQTQKGLERKPMRPIPSDATVHGCYSSGLGLKMMNQSLQYNTMGKCGKDVCNELGYKVGASYQGTQCWCGNTYPPNSTLVDDKECNIPCPGYDWDACGGPKAWTVYNTGIELYGVENAPEPSSSSSITPSATAKPTQSPTDSVIVETTTAAPASNNNNNSGGSNTAAIAAGVVIGVVVLAAAAGGVWFWLRRRRNREIEEEHRRNAAVNAFIHGNKPGSSGGVSMTDSRMDPVLAQRRLSDGSIADNQDYSRRILRVTNA